MLNDHDLARIAARLAEPGATLESSLPRGAGAHDLFEALCAPFRKKDFFDLLLETGKVDAALLETVAEKSGWGPSAVGGALVARRVLDHEEVARILAAASGYPYLDVAALPLDEELLGSFEIEMLRRFHFLPVARAADKLEIVVASADDIEAIEQLEAILGMPTTLRIGSRAAIDRAIDRLVETSVDERVLFADLEQTGELKVVREEEEEEGPGEPEAGGATLRRLVDSIFLKAVRKKASDIHIEPGERALRVRYRIDGTLFEVMSGVPLRYRNAIVSRIKVMAGMDIAERRVPQDGRIKLVVDGRTIDFRVSTLPSIHGESAVIRILDKSALGLDLEKLGFPENDLLKFKRNILKPYGMVLVAGPTGSGKTTTLYSGLEFVKSVEQKFITVEDPVEYQIAGIVQVNVNDKKGLSFAAGLRSIVRQDPNKILVGEIRDFETADIAINAALTGHLVLSTIHANNVIDAVGRLINMGVDPYQFASSFNLVLSQRLVKKICPRCAAAQTEFDPRKIALMTDFEPHRDLPFRRGAGCRDCHHTGYSGREAIYETLELTEEIKAMVIRRDSPIDIKRAARLAGMVTLREAAWNKVASGVTTLDELLRVTLED